MHVNKLHFMKQNILLISIAMCGLLSSCNMGKDKSNDGIATGTDSSMMNNTPSAPTPLATKTDSGVTKNSVSKNNSDSGVTNRTDNVTTVNMPAADVDTTRSKMVVKPNLAKKGKKGSVKININTPSSKKEVNADKDGYYTNAEVLPSFPGGQRALENFFEKNIQYPAEASENGVEGLVNIVFLVDETGKVSSPKVVSSNIGYGIEKEAMRVFSKMPTWTAGKIKGKNVKTKYTLPINFRLD